MSVYIPNEAEKEALKAILLQKAMVIGLYKNQIIPDGNTIFSTLEELPTGQDYGYARKVLTNALKESAAAVADFWTMTVNAAGKAAAVYDDALQEWVFLAPDVAAVNTVYGVFGYTLVLPFDAGALELKVGDVVKGAAGATGVITGINIISGSWGAAAAGNLYIKNQNATAFVNNEVLTKQGVIGTVAVVVGGTGYAVGDIVTVTQAGGAGAKLVVSSVNGGGIVTGLVVVEGGMGYAVATPLPTVKVTGGGDNALTINLSALATTTYAVADTGTLFGGDAHKKLVFVEALTTPIPITVLGQKISYTPTLTLSTG